MSKIEDRLWADLIREPGADRALAATQPLRRGRSLRRAPLAAGTLVLFAAIVATAVTLTASTSTTPAYAVTLNPDGSVSVTLTEVIGVSGVNEALARLGVRVRFAHIEADCTQTGEKARLAPGRAAHEQQEQIVEPQKDGEGLAGINMIIHPDAIPQGDTALIAAQLDDSGRPVATSHGRPVSAASWTVGLYRGAAPTCQPSGESYPG
jgi:hypothetical protein